MARTDSSTGGDRRTLEIAGLTKVFSGRGGTRKALADVSFSVERGRTIAVVGESGAGKTTLIRCVSGLEKATSGTVLVHGKPLVLRPGQISPVQMVFQNPADALDPMRSIGSSVAEPLPRRPRAQRRERVSELLSLVGISPSRVADRPQAFSGGQQQRIVIARALAASPEVLLCDEPTSALDVSVQAQIINLLLDLQTTQGFACIIVTHDLAIARIFAHDTLVLRHGEVRYHGTTDRLLSPSETLDEYVAGLVRVSREGELSSVAAHPSSP